MTKHTPGPWVYAGRAGEPGSYPQFEIGLAVWENFVGDLAGQVHGCRGDEYMQVGGVCSEADARLIAAAPDLLEACKAGLHALRMDADHRGEIEELAAAIAKAEGATP